MGCLGALGERGSPTKLFLGDNGGDAMEAAAPSRGILGIGDFIGLSIGRGLRGRPGLARCFIVIDRSEMFEVLFMSEGFRTLAKEVGSDRKDEVRAGVGSGERALMEVGIGIVCAGSFLSLSSDFAFNVFESDRDLESFVFLLRLRSCCSCIKAASLSLSSSSLVFFLPLSNTGSSSTSI